ncbi:hydrolase [Streptomyces sp. NBC_00006]|uniref:alpha/beta hydrolase n=1 Tax=unclassified Streptomyces TaxID=2593676 RepID=UPI00225A6DF0|nr:MULTISPECIES: hydrolase [unclassified Streptomyces]MCX5535782.1 hydrolase [Streptomyces sp. NBC_00006]
MAVHGTHREAGQLRDAFADFAEEHDCVVLAPLFPAGLAGPNDLDNYKFLTEPGFRADLLLLDMIKEAAERWHIRTDRFHLHGFSGGGQFAHRFFYLHPDRLASLSIGAPGRTTLLDPRTPWWRGTADCAERFGTAPDTTAMADVPVQLVIGEQDTHIEVWEGAEQPGSRMDRISELRENWDRHGIATRLDVVSGAGHNGLAVMPAVLSFLSDRVAATVERRPSGERALDKA